MKAETAELRPFLPRPLRWTANPALFGILPISSVDRWRTLQELHHSRSLELSFRSDEIIPANDAAKQSKPGINARTEMCGGAKRPTKKVWLGTSHD